MKYLKLFEGFESDRISSVISFLSKKINYNNSQDFLDLLKKFSELFDFPLSQISDSEIKYLSVNKALSVGKDKQALNEYGIYCVKYWFSLEEGYLCHTATGNKNKKYRNNSIKNKIDSENLKYLSEKYKISGVLEKVKLSDLKTGDRVVMVCSDCFYGSDHSLILGEIYIDERRPTDVDYYFYQNECSGSVASSFRNEIRIPDRYNTYLDNTIYKYSWSLGGVEDEDDDHCMMHRLIQDDKPLRLENDDSSIGESLWDFNLNLDNTNLEEWRNDSKINKVEKMADFAIIIYLDDILVKNISRIKISKDRENIRKDALSLMNNTYIKNLNINRYLSKLFDKLGIQKDKQDLRNLNSVIKSTMLGEYFMITNYSSSFMNRLVDFITALYKVMIKHDTIYYYKGLIEIFNSIKKKRLEETNIYSNNIKYLKSLKYENVVKMNEVIKETLKIGKLVSDKFGSKKIETIEDLKSIQLQLKMISDLSQDKIFYLSQFASDVVCALRNNTDIEYYIQKEYNDNDYQEDIEKLNKLEKIIIKDFLKK